MGEQIKIIVYEVCSGRKSVVLGSSGKKCVPRTGGDYGEELWSWVGWTGGRLRHGENYLLLNQNKTVKPVITGAYQVVL